MTLCFLDHHFLAHNGVAYFKDVEMNFTRIKE